jgi:hypothetical protein
MEGSTGMSKQSKSTTQHVAISTGAYKQILALRLLKEYENMNFGELASYAIELLYSAEKPKILQSIEDADKETMLDTW